MDVSPLLAPLPRPDLLAAGELPGPTASADGSVGGFGELFNRALHQVDAAQHDASARVEAVETGASDDLVGAMLASQQAGLEFSMLVQVRNKVMSAFDDILKMPV